MTRTQVEHGLFPRLQGAKETAEFFGISKKILDARWKKGVLPAPQRIGRRLLWDRVAVHEWPIQQFRNQPSEDTHSNFFD